MLPVEIQVYWYDHSVILALKKLHALMRPKQFVATLVLGIIALISIFAPIAISTAALFKEVHTASHVNDLSRYVSLAMAEQEIMDRKLDALEDTVIWIGNEVQILKFLMPTHCHAEYIYIYMCVCVCVTPYPYNKFEP